MDEHINDTAVHISELAHHIRSALDHIAWAVSKPTTRGQERSTYFPICTSKEIFDDRVTRNLPNADQEAIELIESVQPFNQSAVATNDDFYLLGEINNWDKHRGVTSTVKMTH